MDLLRRLAARAGTPRIGRLRALVHVAVAWLAFAVFAIRGPAFGRLATGYLARLGLAHAGFAITGFAFAGFAHAGFAHAGFAFTGFAFTGFAFASFGVTRRTCGRLVGGELAVARLSAAGLASLQQRQADAAMNPRRRRRCRRGGKVDVDADGAVFIHIADDRQADPVHGVEEFGDDRRKGHMIAAKLASMTARLFRSRGSRAIR
ncbi:MAG: hypothetical protein KDB14_20165 [Planctomycetales bacterium]|nr:hypothetical protein [Planctomycetales bacterium]